MQTSWLKLSKEKRIDILNQASEKTGLPAIAIEKDWWVTLALNTCFSLEYSNNLIFKGGTSLSKAWNLIFRFSEDIDLAFDRDFLGFEGDLSKNQIKNLRKKSCDFISTKLLNDLIEKLTEWGAIAECTVNAQPVKNSDKDPQTIEIHYQSVFDTRGYLPQRILIEISSRSLMEPTEEKEINSILSAIFSTLNFASEPFFISTVLPQRTFLEKIFLLHEEFSQKPDKIRTSRLSRHLYDLEKLMFTNFGIDALKNMDLYKNIVAHRERFNALRGLDYSNHAPSKIQIIPPNSVIKEWEKDYQIMTQNMIYGEILSFDALINKISELQKIINAIPPIENNNQQ